ncbi:MAG: hypothetical protein ACLP4W_22450 [Mycobacterium sp.]|uniref:hypothetical protein n=1 Tax=Mycobacterium sp. TaxID=1785 RepID=UPI003F95A944
MKNAVQPVTTCRDRTYEYARAKRRRAAALRGCTCLWCGRTFTSWYNTTRWCSHRCRTAAHRGPKTWALITWSPKGQMHASFRWFATAAAARAAAPRGEPFTIVDITVQPDPRVTFPAPWEIAFRTRFIETPYPSREPRRSVRAGAGPVVPPTHRDPEKPPSAVQRRARTRLQPASDHPWRTT